MTVNDEHNPLLELLPAYALDALDADELGVIERHLPACPDCQTELASFAAAVDMLPLAAPSVEPAPDLKQRLLSRVSIEAASAPRITAVRPSLWSQIAQLFAGRPWQPAAVLVIIGVIIAGFWLWRQANTPIAEFALTSTEAAPDAVGTLIVERDGRTGTLAVTGLPPLPADQQYQLWLIKDEERTNGGVFSVDDQGDGRLQVSAPVSLAEYAAFGVTIEPAGGSPAPTGPRVLGFNL